jgi:hypothetical protein
MKMKSSTSKSLLSIVEIHEAVVDAPFAKKPLKGDLAGKQLLNWSNT